MSIVERLLWALTLGVSALVGSGALLAWGLRRRGFHWTWALLGLPISLLLLPKVNGLLGLAGFLACGLACGLGAKWHRADIAAGADHAEIAHARIGIVEVLRDASDRLRRNGGRGYGDRLWGGDGDGDEDGDWGCEGRVWVRDDWLEVGCDGQGRAAWIPAGLHSGSHTLIVGATGSGKTVSEAWIACRLIEAGHGAIVIDPKGDEMLAEQLRTTAETRTTPTRMARTPRSPTRRSRGRRSPSPTTCARRSATSPTRCARCRPPRSRSRRRLSRCTCGRSSWRRPRASSTPSWRRPSSRKRSRTTSTVSASAGGASSPARATAWRSSPSQTRAMRWCPGPATVCSTFTARCAGTPSSTSAWTPTAGCS